MSYRDRSRRDPVMPRIIKLEVSEKNMRGRLIAVVVLLAIAFTAIGVAVKDAFTTDPGWKVMDCYAEIVTYSDDFVFSYYLGTEGKATAEERAINTVYSKGMEDAFRFFTDQPLEDGTKNLAYLNDHLNETVTIEGPLYEALEKLENAGLRYAYLAPVYVEYKPVFLSQNTSEAAVYDPMRNDELKAYVQEAAAYANDPAHVRLELLGNDQVCLWVSEEYKAFLETHEIDTVLDLNWMTNAFVCDYVADLLIKQGFTKGFLASYDGFTRNLGGLEDEFRFNLFNRVDETYELAGSLGYKGAFSVVYLRDYPMNEADRWHYMAYEDGQITTTFLDPADGMSKSAVTDLVLYAADKSCVDLLTVAAPAMIAEELNVQSLLDANAIWSEGKNLLHTEAEANIYLSEEAGYTAKIAE